MPIMMATKRNLGLLLVVPLALLVSSATAWVSSSSSSRQAVVPSQQHSARPFSSTPIRQAGFGGGASDNNNKKKEKKLKPKQQWDRYLGLKKETRVAVAVKIVDSEDWMPVGHVKSIDNLHTVAAVLMQKGLIADHAKRLFPTKITPKQKLEWAYQNEQGEWSVVDGAEVQEEEASLDKKIGFAGTPDPASGFYCVYNEGRLVTGDSDLPSASKKLA